MTRRSFAPHAVLLSLAVLTLAGCPLFPKPVSSVDLERYTGLWYQVAGYPAPFSRDLVGITAEYGLAEDGRVTVFNAGFVGDFDGPLDTIDGFATVVDARTNARLAVAFGGFSFDPLSIGNYWIIDLDTEDYQWSVVSGPLGLSLFILSRTPQLDPEVYAGILARLDARGFDLDRIIEIPQPLE